VKNTWHVRAWLTKPPIHVVTDAEIRSTDDTHAACRHYREALLLMDKPSLGTVALACHDADEDRLVKTALMKTGTRTRGKMLSEVLYNLALSLSEQSEMLTDPSAAHQCTVQAIDLLQRAFKLDPGDADVVTKLAWLTARSEGENGRQRALQMLHQVSRCLRDCLKHELDL
jgi:hypothetical protein